MVGNTGQVLTGLDPLATGVTRQDARGFCAWLTKQDQQSKLLGPDDIYRLPTDEEWSRAVGLPLERGATPAERNGRIRGIFPWGFEWPPPDGVDNLADAQAAKKAGLDAVIPGYDDNSSLTAPVGSLPANDRGISGLGGNVSEWVDTDFDKPANGKAALGTVRGGNWRTANSDEALSSARLGVPADAKRNTIGFRIVVARKPEKPAAP
jgi:formylglycine-generating enzyme required for sulfatase activity